MPDQATSAPQSPVALPGDGQIDIDQLSESEWRALVARSFSIGADRMNTTDALIADNTTLTKAVWDGTAEIRDIVLMGKSFFSGLGKFSRWCARVWVVLKPVIQACTVIAGAYVAVKGAIWAATHGGQPPAPK